jgi:hypothetical protein
MRLAFLAVSETQLRGEQGFLQIAQMEGLEAKELDEVLERVEEAFGYGFIDRDTWLLNGRGVTFLREVPALLSAWQRLDDALYAAGQIYHFSHYTPERREIIRAQVRERKATAKE